MLEVNTKEQSTSAAVLQMLAFIADHDLFDSFTWRTAGAYAPITFWLDCSDLLSWGCADAELVNAENLSLLQQAIADCKAIDPQQGVANGCDLFVCRVNKCRPQGVAYPKNRELWPLFDACGPERAVGLGNPCKPGGARRWEAKIKHAAVKDGPLVYIGHRHCDCFAQMDKCGLKNHDGRIQGFVDEKGKFLNRFEALEVAQKFNQIVTKHPPLDQLLSEDLY